MSKLHYEIYMQGTNWPGMDVGDYARRIIGSGTIDITTAMSSPVLVPTILDGSNEVPLLILKVIGPDAVYVQFARRGQDAPAGNGAHAVTDAAPRILIDEADGRQTIVPPFDGRFAAVQAASLS